MQHGIIMQCAAALHDGIIEAIVYGDTVAVATVDANDGWIDLMADTDGNVCASVCHSGDSECECPTLCAAIEQALPVWGEVQAEYDDEYGDSDNGGLDPAFASWDDFWNYKGY